MNIDEWLKTECLSTKWLARQLGVSIGITQRIRYGYRHTSLAEFLKIEALSGSMVTADAVVALADEQARRKGYQSDKDPEQGDHSI